MRKVPISTEFVQLGLVFTKWEHVLCSTASIETRLSFLEATVRKSLHWGLETTRQNKNKRLELQSLIMPKIHGEKTAQDKKKASIQGPVWGRSFRNVARLG